MKEQFALDLIITQILKITSFWQATLVQQGAFAVAIFALALTVIYLKNKRVMFIKISLQNIKVGLAIFEILTILLGNPGTMAVANEASESAKLIQEATKSASLAEIGIDQKTTQAVAGITTKSDLQSEQPETKPLSEKLDSSLNSLKSVQTQIIQSATQKIAAKLNKLSKKNYKAAEKITALVNNPQDNKLIVTVIDPKGQELSLPVEQTQRMSGTQLRISPKANFTPGKYTLKVTDSATGTETTQDFSWGVLAINPNKAVYAPGEVAKFAIGVLDEKGMMVCDASLKLKVQSEKLAIDDELSSEDGGIKVNPECSVKGYTLKPDFEAEYTLGEGEGEYTLSLTAKTTNGTYSISDMIEVKKDVPFVVERETATRIYPVLSYPVGINITANQDFQGTVTEIVPQSFEIEQYSAKSGQDLSDTNQKGTEIASSKTPRNDVKSYEKVESVSQQTVENQNVLGASTANLRLPFEGTYPVTEEFGGEIEDKELGKKYSDFGVIGHDGIDFDMPKGTEVVSVDDGEVALAKENSDYGTTVVIQHSWGKSYYGHLSKLLVEKGQKVTKSTKIALSGNTGLSSGPHLHFGVKPNNFDLSNGYFGKIDPSPLLGLDLKEKVLGATTNDETFKLLTWNVSLKKGESVKVGYNYKAPEESPQFYTLGQIKLYNADTSLAYSEGRLWQIASDLVVENGDGLLVYGEAANTTPRLRTYTNSSNSFSSEGGTTSSTTGLTFVVKTSPTKQEAVVGHISIDGSNNQILQVSCYNGTSWSNEWSVTVGTGAAPLTRRQFDIAYETNSGDVMVAYSRNATATNAVDYRTKLGSTGCGTANWAGAASFPTSTVLTSANVHWVKLATDRRTSSNLIAATWADSAQDLGASIWSGSAWGQLPSAALDTNLEIIAAGQDIDSFDVDYESNSGDLMVVWGRSGTNAANLVFYKECTGGTSTCTWQATANIGTISDGASAMDISANPASSSNEIVFGSIEDTTRDLSLAYWSGSGWTGTANVDTQAQTPLAGTKLITTGWFTSGSATRSFVTYADNEGGGGGTDQTDIGYATGNGSSFTLSGTDLTPSPAPAIPQKWWDAQMDPFNRGQLMLTLSDNASDLFVKRISMDSAAAVTISNPDSAGSFEQSLSQATIRAFSFAYWQNYWTTLTQRQGIVENDQNGTNLTSHVAQIGERMKVKIQIDTDAGASKNKVLKLQYDKNDNSWADVKPSGEIRPALSTVIKNNQKIGTGDAGSCTSGTSAKTGYFYEGTGVTKSIKLYGSGCHEITFVVDTKNAAAGTTYRFRLYNVTDNTTLSTGVSPYPSFTTVTSGNNTKRYSKSNVSSMPPEANLTSSLAGYWPLNESTWGTPDCSTNVVSDSSGNNISGKACPVTSGPTGGATGHSGNAVDFDGNDDYISLTDNAVFDLNPANNYSWSFWANPDDFESWNTIWTQNDGTKYMNIELHTYAGDGSHSAVTAGVHVSFTTQELTEYIRVASSDNVLSTGTWSHVLVTYDGSQSGAARFSIYVNGVDVTDRSDAQVAGTVTSISPTQINLGGNELMFAGEDFDGKMDEVRYYTRKLNSTEIADLAEIDNSDSYADLKYMMDDAGYDNAASDDATREILQNVSADMTADITLSGDASAGFGISTVTADFNGDGYEDVAGGSAGYDNGGGITENWGQVKIFNGSAITDTTADLTIVGSASGDGLGNSVAAGDVNGDGYSDLIIGARSYSTSTGRVYVYYGGSNMDTTADVTLTGEATSNSFGSSTASADINGDGYSDLIISAMGYSTNTGRVYVYYGGSNMDTTADVTLTGEAAANFFGTSVASADVNKDGFKDVIAGAVAVNKAYVFLGSSSLASSIGAASANVIFTGTASTDFGISVNNAGDVNGDGFEDVVVGADQATTNTGNAFLYYGGNPMNNVADKTFTGEAVESFFGRSVSSAGDINADGYGDLIIGANGYDNGGGSSDNYGKIYIYYGGSNMDTTADLSATGAALGGSLGESVYKSTDINGDGMPDLVAGATGDSKVYIYYQSYAMNSTADSTISGGGVNNNQFGYSSESAGDINGDGYNDWIIGEPGANTVTGKAYIYFGGKSIDSVADVTITGAATNDAFGVSVGGAGDVNGDGYDDIVIGADGNGSTSTGRAYIFYGSPTWTATLTATSANVTISGETANSRFGRPVTGAGDVNGDGFNDVLVGSYNYDPGTGANTGRSYIFYGSSNMSSSIAASSANVKLTGENLDNYFGLVSVGIGDINYDGYSDVAIGAYGYSTSTGRLYIFYGSSGMSATIAATSADVIFTGNASLDSFGRSVSAGDVNGDGYRDLIIGASGYSTSTGRAYIFYGSTSWSASIAASSANATITGVTASDTFGRKIATGDINGDGYDDISLSAEGAAAQFGKVYIFYGSTVMGTSQIASDANLTLSGVASGFFGRSVAVTDINADGYSDVVVGADAFSSSTGRAYLFIGGSSTYYPVYNFAAKSSAAACSALTSISATWGGQTNTAPSSKNVRLQIYRFGSTNAWEDIATDTSATTNSDISISGSKVSSLTEYCDGSNWAYFRTYQDIGTQSLQTDNFTATFTGGGGAETPTLDKLMRHGRWFNSSGVVQPFTF